MERERESKEVMADGRDSFSLTFPTEKVLKLSQRVGGKNERKKHI